MEVCDKFKKFLVVVNLLHPSIRTASQRTLFDVSPFPSTLVETIRHVFD